MGVCFWGREGVLPFTSLSEWEAENRLGSPRQAELAGLGEEAARLPKAGACEIALLADSLSDAED